MRKTEPHRSCSSRPPAISGPSAAIAPPRADHSAIDFVRARPRPQRRDQRERRRIGHAGRDAAEHAGAEEDVVGGRERREQAGGHRQRRCRAAASACARSGRRARRGTAPRRRGRASSRPRSGRARSARSRRPCRCGQGDVGDRQVQVRDGRRPGSARPGRARRGRERPCLPRSSTEREVGCHDASGIGHARHQPRCSARAPPHPFRVMSRRQGPFVSPSPFKRRCRAKVRGIVIRVDQRRPPFAVGGHLRSSRADWR